MHKHLLQKNLVIKLQTEMAYSVLFKVCSFQDTALWYLNLRRSRDCLCSCVRSFVCSLLDSIHSVRFGQLLRCAHKRIVNIMKVYMERKNRQLELIRLRKKDIAFIHVYFFRTDEVNATRVFTLG